MIKLFLKQFSRLHSDKNPHRWTPLTCHRAPHKPFLLLSIMDLIAQGVITGNFVEPSFELVETWNGYWQAVMPPGKTSSMAYPFPRLKSDGFWTMVCRPGFEPNHDYNVTTMVQCRKIYAGARMDETLFVLFLNDETREKLRAAVVETYFAPEIRPTLYDQAMINYDAETFKKTIIQETRETLSGFEPPNNEKEKKARDQGFRKAIVQIYEHRCALCGIRMLTPEGHTVVEAAHIVPWSRSHDDRPANGLCLCRICHWSFDEGLMAVGSKYEVIISNRVRSDKNLPGHLQTLVDRPIIKPEQEMFWPGQENLKWHKKAIFAR